MDHERFILVHFELLAIAYIEARNSLWKRDRAEPGVIVTSG